jgi:hypothetical protein
VEDEFYLPPMPVTLSNLKDRIRTASAWNEHPLVQNVRHEVGYRLDVCRATNGEQTELAQGMKGASSVVLYKAVRFIVGGLAV